MDGDRDCPAGTLVGAALAQLRPVDKHALRVAQFTLALIAGGAELLLEHTRMSDPYAYGRRTSP